MRLPKQFRNFSFCRNPSRDGADVMTSDRALYTQTDRQTNWPACITSSVQSAGVGLGQSISEMKCFDVQWLSTTSELSCIYMYILKKKYQETMSTSQTVFQNASVTLPSVVLHTNRLNKCIFSCVENKWMAPWKNRISSTTMKLRKSLVKRTYIQV